MTHTIRVSVFGQTWRIDAVEIHEETGLVHPSEDVAKLLWLRSLQLGTHQSECRLVPGKLICKRTPDQPFNAGDFLCQNRHGDVFILTESEMLRKYRLFDEDFDT